MDRFSYSEDRDTHEYLLALLKLFRQVQKLERDFLLLLKERRTVIETGFDTLVMREDAAQILGLSTRQFDRIAKSGKLKAYKTIYGTRYRMGDIVAFAQMRGEVNSALILKDYNPWSKRMTDLDKLLGQLTKMDLSHPPLDLL